MVHVKTSTSGMFVGAGLVPARVSRKERAGTSPAPTVLNRTEDSERGAHDNESVVQGRSIKAMQNLWANKAGMTCLKVDEGAANRRFFQGSRDEMRLRGRVVLRVVHSLQ
jgi:hypothetical protein